MAAFNWFSGGHSNQPAFLSGPSSASTADTSPYATIGS